MTYAIRTCLVFLAVLAGVVSARAADPHAYRLLRLDGAIVKWGEAVLGMPAHVTYAFADGPVSDARARNCKAMEPLAGLAQRAGLSPDAIEAEARAAFALWQALAGVTFARAERIEDADIVIGAQARPRGYAFANVRTARKTDAVRTAVSGGERGLNGAGPSGHERGAGDDRDESEPISAIEKSAICLNPKRGWKIGQDGSGDAYDLKYTFAHEIGHAIGLDHNRQPGQLMFFKYSEAFAGPQAGDIEGARVLYGPPVVAAR